MAIVALIFSAAFLGSIPTGYLIGRLYGVDLRDVGSGNIGATNANRVLGRRAGGFTFLGDMTKGFLAASLPYIFLGQRGDPIILSPELSPILGLSAIIAHCFTPFLKFRGGKGIATGFGVFMVLAPFAALLAVLLFFLLAKGSGYVSVGSLGAALVLSMTILSGIPKPYPQVTIFTSLVVLFLVSCRHRRNISRLFKQEELPLRVQRKDENGS